MWGQEAPEEAVLPPTPSQASPWGSCNLSEAFHFRGFLNPDHVRLNANWLQKIVATGNSLKAPPSPCLPFPTVNAKPLHPGGQKVKYLDSLSSALRQGGFSPLQLDALLCGPSLATENHCPISKRKK